jgi:hypothetical protein
VEELSDPKLRQPCRKVLESLQEHWTGLTRFAGIIHKIGGRPIGWRRGASVGGTL